MKRLRWIADSMAMEAMSHGFVWAYRLGGRRGARWVAQFVTPKVERILRSRQRKLLA